jgi:ABC-2 type transport system permease protein
MILHQFRYDLLAFVRNRQSRFFTLVLPVLFLVIFVSVFGNDRVGPDDVKASTYYVPGISALAVVAGSFVNLVISVTAQRESGVLKRRRATPVPAWVLIAGRTLTAIVVALGTMTVLLLIGRFAYGVKLPTSTLPGVIATAVVGAVSFCCLAYALTTFVKSEDAAQPMVQAIMLPLYFISGVFIPNVNLPRWLRDVAEFFPSSTSPTAFTARSIRPPAASGSSGATSASLHSGAPSGSRSHSYASPGLLRWPSAEVTSG